MTDESKKGGAFESFSETADSTKDVRPGGFERADKTRMYET